MKSPQTGLLNKKRLVLLFYIALAVLLFLIGRMVQLMFFNSENLQERAETQWTREISVTANRGRITDRNGDVIAQSATAESVLIHPQDVKDPGVVASALAPILEMDEQKIFDVASDKKRIEVWLKRHVSSEQADKIRELKLSGVEFFTDTRRYYMYNDMASQVIGYTNMDGDGQEGIEKAYNKYLDGYDGTKLVLVDALGRTIANSEQEYVEPQDGLNVVMTIDAKIQSFAESAAQKALEANNAKRVGVIVMDPQNADVLAMVNYPGMDLNNIDRSDIQALNELSRNVMVVDAYEPGSTFKIITTASAIDSGAATAESQYTCTGAKLVDGERIKCWRTGRPHGTQVLHEAVENSCNPAFMEMALSMGTETFYDYIHKFGFGSKTNVDYSADGTGIVRAAKYVKNVDLARIGFGQSVAVTPLQLATAVSAAINGGQLYTPRLVSHMTDSEGRTVVENESKVVDRVISEETSAMVREILEGVVQNGSGKNCRIDGYRVGGKTGTAQIYDENGAIVEGKHISSFVGFAPANDPKYLCLFVVYEPNVYVDFGSVVAAPYAKEILEKCLKLGNIPSEGTDTEEMVETPDFVGKTAEEAQTLAQESGLSIDMAGTGKIAAQSPVEGTQVAKGSIIELVGEQTAQGEAEKTPDVVGKSLSTAYTILHKAGLQMSTENMQEGNGKVASQSPKAGDPMPADGIVRITCGKLEGGSEDETQ